MLTGILPIAGSSLVTAREAPGRGGEALGDVGLAALAQDVGGELNVARNALDREAARGEQVPQPVEVAVEVVEARDVLGGPVEDVLVVVAAPRHPRLAVARLLVGELGGVAAADLGGRLGEVDDPAAGQPRLGGRRHPARALGHSATTSYVCRWSRRSRLI